MERKTFTYEGHRYDVTAKTKEELAVKVELKKRDLKEGRITVDGNTLVRDWAKKWLKTYKENAVSEETRKDYETRLNKHILPKVGILQMKDVRPIHLQEVLNGMSGYSKDYISKIRHTMKQMFKKAVDNKLILSNPAADLDLPVAVDGTRRSITETERKYILQIMEYHKAGLWLKIMYYCGLRSGECAALQYRHIDFNAKTVRVEEARKRNNRIGDTKTEAGHRTIPIPSPLLESLLKTSSPFDYVLTNQKGGRLSKANMAKLWKSFKREMHIVMGGKVYRNELVPPFPVADDLVPYCLRHTFCTDLQAAGVPINIAKELMGHKDIAITAKIYTHHSQTAFNAAAAAMEKYHEAK